MLRVMLYVVHLRAEWICHLVCRVCIASPVVRSRRSVVEQTPKTIRKALAQGLATIGTGICHICMAVHSTTEHRGDHGWSWDDLGHVVLVVMGGSQCTLIARVQARVRSLPLSLSLCERVNPWAGGGQGEGEGEGRCVRACVLGNRCTSAAVL